ncbi:sulfite exporter TauE/SafE family protein [Cyclobacterium jeungdonense]|uniref:Probable membrane transporter protein n=1 Tax=Cyclobacterium jeungdonense TaxID=708087 RepID=A0ABT8CCK0_9BACT|nr:sulfite exporter TauE/SafE family protein [Cyclobacterium jeungdonense]MDN3690245.1 sulfite exporter TauE/SafE family protein [Cyclobacterium jeungdonense]
MEILGYFFLFFVGLTLGILGSGGSILAVPILVYLFSMDAVLASAYSLFIVGITSLVGTALNYHAQLVNVKTGSIFGIPSILSIFLMRKWIVPAIPDKILQIETFSLSKNTFILGVFAFLMILASLKMIYGRTLNKGNEKRTSVFSLVFFGLLSGLITGLVGVGGGFLIIPILGFLTKTPLKTAIGTTLFIVASNSLIGFMGDILNYSIHWNFLLVITSLAVSGIYVGSRIGKVLPTLTLQRFFGWFTLTIGTLMVIKELILIG